MGLNFIWENDAKTILRFEADGEWTWPEYDKFIDTLVEEVKAQNHEVHIIVLAAKQFPPGSPIPHLRRVTKLMPDNVGKIVISGGNLFVRSINTAVSKIHPAMSKQLMFAADPEEARTMLKRIMAPKV
jgi:hypothetical protein